MLQESRSATEISMIARPEYANSIGTVFGGRLLDLMDMAASICARRHCQLKVATAGIEQATFVKPIPIGKVIKIIANITRSFTSSMEIQVEVISEDTCSRESVLAARAYFYLVGLDEHNKPVKVPEYMPGTEAEKARWKMAELRRKSYQERTRMGNSSLTEK
jgi:acyl-CoA hydrolase